MIQNFYPGSGSRLFTHPRSRIKIRIRNTAHVYKYICEMFLCLMIELAGLLALEPIVFLLGSVVDQVGNDERGRHCEDRGPEHKED
jgi:hypothetical protein